MRLIDADELTEMVWRERLDTRERIANLIARQPTIESMVKRGRWFHINNDDFIYCSECNHEAYWDTDYGQQLFDYCPYCGAKMVREG